MIRIINQYCARILHPEICFCRLLKGSASILAANWLCYTFIWLLQSIQAEHVPFCQKEKVYLLDLNELAGSDVPTCNIDDIAVVNPANGVVYHPQAKLKDRVSHRFGTHSGPW